MNIYIIIVINIKISYKKTKKNLLKLSNDHLKKQEKEMIIDSKYFKNQMN